MTTVWHNFQANTSSKKISTRLFWVSGAKGCRGGSSYGFWKKFKLGVVRGSETQTKSKKHGIVVASPLHSIINDQVEAMREDGISGIALPCRGTMR